MNFRREHQPLIQDPATLALGWFVGFVVPWFFGLLLCEAFR